MTAGSAAGPRLDPAVALAAYAAIAVDAARRLTATRAALAELEAVNERVRRRSAAVERAAQAYQGFSELVLAGGQPEDVVRAVAAVLDREVAMLGEQDSPIAVIGQPPQDDPALQQAVDRARAAQSATCVGTFWAVPAMAGSEHLGTLVLRAGPDLTESDRLILERAAMAAASLLLLRHSVAEAEQRVRGELLCDLITGPLRDVEALRARALRLGADLDRPHLVLVAHAGPEARPRLRQAAGHLAATRHGLAADHEGWTVLLLPGADPSDCAPDTGAALTLAAGSPVTVGAAGPSGRPAAIAEAYTQARRCAEALLALGRGGDAATLGDLGFLGMLLSDRRDVPGFIRSAIGCLLDYDADRGTDLVRTVEAYFRAGGSVTRTKDALHVHVNTVAQRLERITHLLGDDWQLGERALEIRVAVHLRRLGTSSWADESSPGTP